MTNYALTTWSADRLIGYEPVVAATPREAIAFIQGLLTERTRDHGNTLAKLGVRYVVESGIRSVEQLSILTPADRLGVWHLVEGSGSTTLVWESHEAD